MRRSRKALLLLALPLLGGAAWYLLLGRPQRSDYEQVRSIIADIEEAVEAKSVRGCLKHVSDVYHDEYGNDRHELWRKAMQGFRQPEPLNLVLSIRGMRPGVDTYEVDLLLDLSAGTGPSARAVRDLPVTVRFQREGRRWRIVSATGFEDAAPVVAP